MKIIVLAGGNSPESEVSVCSGLAVAKALCLAGCKVALLHPSQFLDRNTDYFSDNFSVVSEIFSDSLNSGNFSGYYISFDVLSYCRKCDRVFLALHGGDGENGRLQAVLRTYGINFTGSLPEACFVAMDKVRSKQIYEYAGILTPLFTVFKKGQHSLPVPPRYPCVIKPADGGSSFGVTIAYNPSMLVSAVDRALEFCDTVIMEEKITGREFSCSILNDQPVAVTEIIPKNSFFDYESKYISGAAREITPAPISDILTHKAMSVALRAHKALGLSNFSRTDMILSEKSNLFYTLETNTLPGMTETSILPAAAAYAGYDFTSLCLAMMTKQHSN